MPEIAILLSEELKGLRKKESSLQMLTTVPLWPGSLGVSLLCWNVHDCVLFSELFVFSQLTENAIEEHEDKRGEKLLPVAFQCGKKTALCRNSGRGPKVTMSRKRRGTAMCVCLCPPGYTRPQCARNNKPVR